MTKRYERVVFMQDDEADEVLRVLDEQGEEAAIEHLSQWHYPGEHDGDDELAAGSSDDVYTSDDGYVLTWNTRLGYVGLEYDTCFATEQQRFDAGF